MQFKIFLKPSLVETLMKPISTGIDIRKQIDELLLADDLEGVLRTIENTVDTVFIEPLNTAEIFGDRTLDKICQKTGEKCLLKIKKTAEFHSFNKNKLSDQTTHTVFIVSRLQASGGHTALLADIAKQSKTKISLLVTGIGGSTNLESIHHIFEKIENLQFEFAPTGSRLIKLEWLQRKLLSLRPEIVWLFNHHQDSVAIAAVQPDQGYRLKFLHHGDHHLCLGVFLEFGEHYDPHPMGFHNCRGRLLNLNNRYLPLVIDDPQLRPVKKNNGPLISCTAASSNKVEHTYWPSYSDVVPEILAKTGGTHIHIGRLSWFYRYRIKKLMRKKNINPETFIYIPYVKSVALSLQHFNVDIYIASFPYAGARTLVEVMAAGIPTAGHDHRSSHMLSAVDMLPPMSYVWTHVDQLINFIEAETKETLQERGKAARSYYEAHHTLEKFQIALEGDLSEQNIPQSSFLHKSDELLRALEKSWQFSIKGFISRWIKLQARKIKSIRS